jgi:hypothetical protein
MCDHLGFRETIRHSALADVVFNYHVIMETVLKMQARPLGTKGAKVAYVRFADTVLFTTDDPGEGGMQDLVRTVASFAASCAGLGSPVRVGISFGEVFQDPVQSLNVGEGIIAAHDVEQSQDWAGGIIEEESLARAGLPKRALAPLGEEGLIFEYNAPVKSGYRRAYCLGWPQDLNITSTVLRARLDRSHAPYPAAALKIDETLRFFDAYKAVYPNAFDPPEGGLSLRLQDTRWVSFSATELAELKPKPVK